MAKCRSCNAEITWALTTAGRWMPLDAKPCQDGNLVTFHEGDELHVRSAQFPRDQLLRRYRSHFVTCPNADRHRKD